MYEVNCGNVYVYHYVYDLKNYKYFMEDFWCSKKEYYNGDKLSHTIYRKPNGQGVFDQSLDKVHRAHDKYIMYSLSADSKGIFLDKVCKALSIALEPKIVLPKVDLEKALIDVKERIKNE